MSGKVYAVQDSIRKLLTKLDVSIRAIDFISSRIHELRDEELQPKVAALIHGYEHACPLFLMLPYNQIHKCILFYNMLHSDDLVWDGKN